MINFIIQHSYDHHRAVILTAKYGWAELLEHILKSGSRYFPMATYSLQNKKTVRRALYLATTHHHYHIMKWFASVNIIDAWLVPRTIYHKPIEKYYQHLIYLANIRYANKTGNLALLLELKELDKMFPQYGTDIVACAFKRGPPKDLTFASTIDASTNFLGAIHNDYRRVDNLVNDKVTELCFNGFMRNIFVMGS